MEIIIHLAFKILLILFFKMPKFKAPFNSVIPNFLKFGEHLLIQFNKGSAWDQKVLVRFTVRKYNKSTQKNLREST